VHHRELCAWRDSIDLNDKTHPFLHRLYTEDIWPAFNFVNRELAERVLDAAERGVLCIEHVAVNNVDIPV
jgi:hypothetical protein